MKSNYNYYNIILLVVVFISCSKISDKHEYHQGKNKDHISDSTASRMKYYCPMHPEVMSDKPGTCPICGMDLELLPDEEAVDTLSYLSQPTNKMVVSSLKPIAPTRNKDAKNIQASGFLTYDPNLTNSISARVSGRIEKLYAKYEFQSVKKGDLLMEIYSPELQTAQSDYLFLYKSSKITDEGMLDAYYQKLINLGMTVSAIKQLEFSGQIKSTVSIYSPYSGHLHFLTAGSDIASHNLAWPISNTKSMDGGNNMSTTKSLTIKEGDYVNKNDLLFTIANESTIWALFKILPRDISFIKKGDEVTVNIDGDTHIGKVDFIEKSFDSGNDFYTIRVYLHCNDHNKLAIGTLIEGVIVSHNNQKTYLWIPQAAAIVLGKSHAAVFVKQNLGYMAKEVTVGQTSDGWIEVLSGLSDTDSIAPVASYLVDSEALIDID
ncbi:MAG: HlyD family efflux transporter periplasmic adaptor subunit [Cytophagaceae bacterium]